MIVYYDGRIQHNWKSVHTCCCIVPHFALQTLHVKEVVGTLRAEALLLSGEASERVDAAADTLVQVHKDLQTRLRNTTEKVGVVASAITLAQSRGNLICRNIEQETKANAWPSYVAFSFSLTVGASHSRVNQTILTRPGSGMSAKNCRILQQPQSLSVSEDVYCCYPSHECRARVIRRYVSSDRAPLTRSCNDGTHACKFSYQLRAVVIHRGGSANSGHYYCYVRHGDGEFTTARTCLFHYPPI